MRVVVFDYGSGNIRSVTRALVAAGADVELTVDPAACAAADGLVVPGVGAFATCAAGLAAVGGREIVQARLADRRPVLGICVGHQVMFERGVEHGVASEGLGVLPGVVEKLDARPLPHMGWNLVEPPAGSAMFAGVAGERFYFVHSYAVRERCHETAHRHVTPWFPDVGRGARDDVGATWATHGGDRFVAAVEVGPLWSTQFHPEKSGAAGARLLRNWIETLGDE